MKTKRYFLAFYAVLLFLGIFPVRAEAELVGKLLPQDPVRELCFFEKLRRPVRDPFKFQHKFLLFRPVFHKPGELYGKVPPATS